MGLSACPRNPADSGFWSKPGIVTREVNINATIPLTNREVSAQRELHRNQVLRLRTSTKQNLTRWKTTKSKCNCEVNNRGMKTNKKPQKQGDNPVIRHRHKLATEYNEPQTRHGHSKYEKMNPVHCRQQREHEETMERWAGPEHNPGTVIQYHE